MVLPAVFFFFPANVLSFPHCDKSLLWKEPVRPRSPEHSTLGKGLNSAMPELRAESQSFTLRPGVGLAAAGHVLAVGSSLPAARSPPASALPQLPGRERGGSARRRAGAARSRLWHDRGLAPGTGSVIPCMNVRARVGSGGCRGGGAAPRRRPGG